MIFSNRFFPSKSICKKLYSALIKAGANQLMHVLQKVSTSKCFNPYFAGEMYIFIGKTQKEMDGWKKDGHSWIKERSKIYPEMKFKKCSYFLDNENGIWPFFKKNVYRPLSDENIAIVHYTGDDSPLSLLPYNRRFQCGGGSRSRSRSPTKAVKYSHDFNSSIPHKKKPVKRLTRGKSTGKVSKKIKKTATASPSKRKSSNKMSKASRKKGYQIYQFQSSMLP